MFPHPSIYLGDLNSHHQEWCYEDNDDNGELLVEWASMNSLHLVFDANDRHIFFSGAHRRGYNPDLCFISCDDDGISLQSLRSVMPFFPNSQHRPIIYQFGLSVPLVAFSEGGLGRLYKTDGG